MPLLNRENLFDKKLKIPTPFYKPVSSKSFVLAFNIKDSWNNMTQYEEFT